MNFCAKCGRERSGEVEAQAAALARVERLEIAERLLASALEDEPR